MQQFERETPCGTLAIWIPDNPPVSFMRQIEDGELYEPQTVLSMHTALSEDAIVFDVGARWGYFSRLALLCGARKVVAFEEGGRDCLPVLGRNVKGRPIHVEKMTVDLSADLPSADTSRPDLVKIDVEGQEHGVINYLAAYGFLPSTLLIEMHPEYIIDAGSSQEAIVEQLRDRGYELTFTANHREEGAEWAVVDTAELPSGVTDYLIRAER